MSDEPLENVDVAEDGSPLGTLKVAGKVYVPKPMERMVATAERELVRSESVDITGDDDADEELLSLYEGYSDNEKRSVALVRYVKDGMTAAQVAAELGVPERTVLMWAYKGKWNRAASRELAVRMEEEARALVNLRLKHRESLLARQLEDSTDMQRRLMEGIRSGETHVTKSSAEALAALAKVQNAAMGVADSGNIVTGVGEAEKKADKAESGGKVPLVVNFNSMNMAGIPVLGKKSGVTVEVKE